MRMASKQEATFPLRLLVDREINRVVLAEASGDFIDILFSFLTLPLGTIMRLVSNNPLNQPAEIGCINNLYRSVENFNADVFWNKICKQMLLFPRNPCEALHQKLKLKVDDTGPTKYFMCSSKCRRAGFFFLSTFAEVTCSCGKLMDQEMKLQVDSSEEEKHQSDGAFVKVGTMFLIFDDLKVLHSSPGNSVQQLVQLGYRDFNKLTELFPNVGLKEILDLLKQALTSKSPLSDVFLVNCEAQLQYPYSPKPGPKRDSQSSYCFENVKVTVSKSKNKILYAEAEGDFVDFLFSFLTAPLGAILKLLDGNSRLGCMDNLYTSVKNLNSSWFTIKNSSGTTPLLNTRAAAQFSYSRTYSPFYPLQLHEEETPNYYYGTGVIKNNICYHNSNGVISKNYSLVHSSSCMALYEPRSPNGTRESNVSFVRRPSIFIVSDELQITPLANTSSISFLQKLNVPLDDLEEHVLNIGDKEALNLLGASLTSKAALTEGLFYLLKKPKGEAKA